MNPRKFSVKYFTASPISFELPALIPVFHRWIQAHSVDGMLIDVADYKHVYQGPGIMLIGHEADYSFDLRGGAGVVYTRKRDTQGALVADLTQALRAVVDAGRKLEQEDTLNGLKFDYTELEITFLDRLNTPNTPEAFEAIRAHLAEALGVDASKIILTSTDKRHALTLRVQATLEIVAG